MQKFVKIFGYIILFTLCSAFIIRCIMVSDKSTFSKLTVTDEMIAAYTDEESMDFVKTVDIASEISPDGYFCSYSFFYVPAASQAQVTVRWNNSIYGYTDMAEGTEFEFELLNKTTGVSVPCVSVDAKRKTIYNFRKLTADGVTFGPDDEIVIVMKLRDGFTSEQVICYAEQPMEDYKLSKSETKLLLGES
jgi:hypothetical protein